MPKQVDHEARRTRIAEALERIASRGGLEAVSLRDVAAEAGMSMGAVQHYFKTKEDMLLHAMNHANGKLGDRVRERVAETGNAPRQVLRAIMIEMLPISELGRADFLLAVAFLLRSLTTPRLAAVYRKDWPKLQAMFGDVLRAAWEEGQLAPDVDVELEAENLLALPDGLAAGLLLGHRSAEQSIAVVDYQLDRVFRD